MPYASLQPNGSSFLEYKQSLVSWAVKAQQLGFAAAKCECTLTGPYNHSGTHLLYTYVLLQRSSIPRIMAHANMLTCHRATMHVRGVCVQPCNHATMQPCHNHGTALSRRLERPGPREYPSLCTCVRVRVCECACASA